MIVLGGDPGKITGLALWEQHVGWTQTEVSATRVLPSVAVMLANRRPTAIACERFVQGTGRRPMSFQPDAQHVSGELSGLAQLLQVPFIRQLAGPSKKIASDKVLKKIGAYVATEDGHANDAARQVIRYLADHHPDVFAELIGI